MNLSSVEQYFRGLLPKNRFARGISILAGGNAASQILMVVTSPIITRLYSPEDFGVLSVYLALQSVISVVIAVRYEQAIPLPATDKEATSVAVGALISVTVLSTISAILVLLIRDSVADIFNSPQLAGYLLILPIGLLSIGSYTVFRFWAVRKQEYSSISRTRLAQTTGVVISQFILFKLGSLGLIISQVASQVLGILRLGKLFGKNFRLPKYKVSGHIEVTGKIQTVSFVFQLVCSAQLCESSITSNNTRNVFRTRSCRIICIGKSCTTNTNYCV